ncbi:MAG: hypothetical protein GY858_00960 [Candidatus Omnitrophica bacterium]|nr:hypothetical protein [Candidatus Omnitrophota bacterium]
MILNVLRRVLFLVILIFLVYVLFSRQEYVIGKTINKIDSSVLKRSKENEKKDYQDFLSKVKKCAVFDVEALKPKKVLSKKESKKIDKTIKNLRLAGVITAGGQRAVIESKSGSTTFYVQEQEVFLDSIRVDRITNKSVTLRYKGEVFELYL